MESFHRSEVASAHIFHFFELDICGLSSRYFISSLPFCPVPDCTRLCEKETNLKVIQSVMGHKDIQTTMDIYAEATEEKKQESFERLAATLDIF